MTLAEKLLDFIIPIGLKLSPDCKSVLYSAKPRWSATQHTRSSLWVAKTAESNSARQVTDGSNDRMAAWSSDGHSVAFLSDRGGSGEACAIYHLALDGGEPRAITPATNLKAISKFSFSPSGRQIAYICPPEKDANDTVDVWDQDWEYANLHLVDVDYGSVKVLFNHEAHVVDFCWNDNGNEIAIFTHHSPDPESTVLHGATISVIHIADASKRTICQLPRELSNLTWIGSNIFFTTYSTPSNDSSSSSVYVVGTLSENPTFKKVAHGDDDCAEGLSRAGNEVLVHVRHGMEDQLRLLNGKTLYQNRRDILDFDAGQGDHNNLELVVAEGTLNRPPEVFAISGSQKRQLSNHGKDFEGEKFGHTRFIECQTLDGKEKLEGMFLVPSQLSDQDGKPSKALPTIVLVHGGPYWRITDCFDAMNVHFVPRLLAQGWGLLIPNYRGSSGRGDRFARHSGRGSGTTALSDIVAMTQHAIEQGYSDQEHLIIAGHSQGGFLSYLAAVRNGLHNFDWRFRAAIPTAGVTDCDTMAMTSDIGYIQGNLAGGRPWNMEKGDSGTRIDSAIWEFKDAAAAGRIPPMLMLHGMEDVRVPISQTQGFRRALDEAGLPFEFAAYPGEDHFFHKRKAAKDMMERIVRFVASHI